jgi:hypothetical protein
MDKLKVNFLVVKIMVMRVSNEAPNFISCRCKSKKLQSIFSAYISLPSTSSSLDV